MNIEMRPPTDKWVAEAGPADARTRATGTVVPDDGSGSLTFKPDDDDAFAAVKAAAAAE